jgi:hypothetical protein
MIWIAKRAWRSNSWLTPDQKRLLDDAVSIGWPAHEARRAIVRLIDVHLSTERKA